MTEWNCRIQFTKELKKKQPKDDVRVKAEGLRYEARLTSSPALADAPRGVREVRDHALEISTEIHD